ncbi:MAG TPA: hypothetical protein VF933_00550 [Streptosporangiaceae bacterium]
MSDRDSPEVPSHSYPNGTIGCSNPVHKINQPPPPGLNYEEHVRWVVDHAPPLTEEQRDELGLLLGFR